MQWQVINQQALVPKEKRLSIYGVKEGTEIRSDKTALWLILQIYTAA